MKIVHPVDFSDCAEQARALAVQLSTRASELGRTRV